MKLKTPLIIAAALIATATNNAAFAQSEPPAPTGGISLDLKAAGLIGEACRITFVVTNRNDGEGNASICADTLKTSGRLDIELQD